MSTETKMIFIDGVFMRGEEIVPVEFGNTEQIALINELSTIKRLESNGEYMLYASETLDEKDFCYLEIKFHCICGRKTKHLIESIDVDVADFPNETVLHCQCGLEWTGTQDEFYYNFKISAG